MNGVMEAATVFFYFGTFFSYVAFLVLFFRSHWWRTSMGQHVFFFMLILAVLFGLGILRRIIGPEWFELHRTALSFWSFGATFVVGWWRVILLIKAQGFNPKGVMVRKDQRVVVEGDNQRITLEGSEDDPDASRKPAFD